MNKIKELFLKLNNGKFLSKNDSVILFDLIFSEKLSEIEISSLLTFLNLQGESFENIYGAVEVLKKYKRKIDLNCSDLIDTCGTGGDNKESFNISTATSVLASACGLKVAKHGNRSVTSKTGSSDILESLGINIFLSDVQLKKYFKKNNICFLYAPNFHKSLKIVSNVRRLLPFKTIFNLVGPLLNPAKLKYQLLGVGNPSNLLTHAKYLSQSSIKSAWVIHSAGYDELTTTAPNIVYKIKNKKVSKKMILNPKELGFKLATIDELKGGNPKENSYIMFRLFEGETGGIRDCVLLNTAACLMIAGKVKTIVEGIEYASNKIDDYSAKKKLEQLIEKKK